MKLLLLNDIIQLEYVLTHRPKLVTTHRPVTQDVVVAHELSRLQIPFLDEFRYLSPKELEDNWDEANALADVWQDYALHSDARLGLGELAKQEFVWPFEISLNARTVYRRILESNAVEGILGYWWPPKPVYRTGPAPVTRAAGSVAQAVLRWLAEQKQIPIESLHSPRWLAGEGCGWRPRQSGVAVSVNDGPIDSRDKVVVVLETGLRAHEQAVLEAHFAAAQNYRLVRMSPWELGPDGLLAAAIQLRECDAALQNARRGLARGRVEYRGPYPEIFANPYLEFQFLRVIDEIGLAARVGAGFGSVLEVLRPSLVILGHDAFTRERMLVREAQQRGIPTVSLIHGGLWHSMGARGIVGSADHLLVWGENDAGLLESYGVDPARIHAVGSLQYAVKYSQVDQVCGVGQAVERQVAAKRRLGLAATQPVVALLTASTSAGFAEVIADQPRHRDSWMELVRLAESRPNITFVIKPHPSYDHFAFYRYLTRRGSENVVLLESATLDDVLAAAAVAVLVNACTTAALEAMLAHVPVVFIRNAILPLDSREDSLKEHGSVPVTTLGELGWTLDRLLEDVAARQAALEDAKWVLQKALGEKERPPLALTGSVLDQIALDPLSAVSDPAPPGGDDTFALELARAARMLWAGAGPTAYLQAVRDLHGPAKEASRLHIWTETELFGQAYSLALTAANPSTLLQLARDSLAAIESVHSVSAMARQQFLLTACLAALIHAVDTGRWKAGRSYAWFILTRIPGATARSNVFWRYLVKSLMASGGPQWTLVGFIERTYFRWSRLQPAGYQEIE